MKFLTLCVLLALAVSVKSSKEMFMKIMTDCKASVGATDDDIAKMMMHAPAENQQQKCLFSCIMKSTGVIKGGKLEKEGVIGMVKEMHSGDADMLKHAAGLFDDCSGITDADECEAAYKIGKCFKENETKRGINMGMAI